MPSVCNSWFKHSDDDIISLIFHSIYYKYRIFVYNICTNRVMKLGRSHLHPSCKAMKLVYPRRAHTIISMRRQKKLIQETRNTLSYRICGGSWIYTSSTRQSEYRKISSSAMEITPTSCSWLHANPTSEWMSQFGGTRGQGIISSISSSGNWSITLSRIVSFFKWIVKFAICLGIWSIRITSKFRLESHKIQKVNCC